MNKLIYDLRHQQPLRIQLLKDPKAVAKNYGLSPEEIARIDTHADESIEVFRSLKSHPSVEVGAHPLALLMCLGGGAGRRPAVKKRAADGYELSDVADDRPRLFLPQHYIRIE